MIRPSPQLQRRASVVVSVIALAAVAWWVSKQDAPRFPSSAGGYLWLVGALGVYALALVARGWRWHRIMRLAGIPHRRADAYRLTLVGYMGNNVLPARGGEVLRIAILGSRTTAKRRTILGSIIAERILDAAVLAALFAVLTWFDVAHAPAGQWPASVAAVGLVLEQRLGAREGVRLPGRGVQRAGQRVAARQIDGRRRARLQDALCAPEIHVDGLGQDGQYAFVRLVTRELLTDRGPHR